MKVWIVSEPFPHTAKEIYPVWRAEFWKMLFNRSRCDTCDTTCIYQPDTAFVRGEEPCTKGAGK